MPLYDYKCAEHGVFQELVPVDAYDKPCACPVCGSLSARVVLISPQILAMAKERRQAIERNEAARHVPKISTVESRLEEQERKQHAHKHGAKCGCGDRKLGSKLFYTADGGKMFPSMRPWMISH